MLPNPDYPSERLRCCPCARCRYRTLEFPPLAYLDCARFDTFGPAVVFSSQEIAFWREHDPLCRPWLCEAIERGLVQNPDVARFGVFALLSSVLCRRDGATGWSGLTAHEILFHDIRICEIDADDAIEIVRAMRSFVCHLGRRRSLAAGEVDRLTRELDEWAPRFVDYVDRSGPWYRSDGTPELRDTVPTPTRSSRRRLRARASRTDGEP
jgi:hypothetical protein